MMLGSHNSWSYLTPKKWWMKLFSFTAKCQDLSIIEQYDLGVRCFDLRVRFDKDCELKVCHGLFEYDITEKLLYQDLYWLDCKKDVYVRVLHEVRNKKQYTSYSINRFIHYCAYISNEFKNIKFWCGRNLYNWNIDYNLFNYFPTCEEKYSSVCKPKLIDDWYPRLFAKLNNKKILEEGTNKDILLIDFVNYGN